MKLLFIEKTEGFQTTALRSWRSWREKILILKNWRNYEN